VPGAWLHAPQVARDQAQVQGAVGSYQAAATLLEDLLDDYQRRLAAAELLEAELLQAEAAAAGLPGAGVGGRRGAAAAARRSWPSGRRVLVVGPAYGRWAAGGGGGGRGVGS
jgi:hypothetical protein